MSQISVCNKKCKHQLGGMLIESLVGVLIIGIIGGGIMHATARMLNAQRDAAVTNIAVNELRPLIMSRTTANGVHLCDATSLSLTVMGQSLDINKENCDLALVNIADENGNPIASNIEAPKPIVLFVGSNDASSPVKPVVVGGTRGNGT